MPNNFTEVASKYIGFYIVYTLFFFFFTYAFQGGIAGNSSVLMAFIAIFSFSNYIVFGLALGYGIRNLLHTNNYKVSVNSILLFGVLMAAVPTIVGALTMYIQSFSNDIMASAFSSGHYLYSLVFAFLLRFVYSLFIISIVGRWLVYKKAGKKGWYSLVPILNVLTLIRMVKKPDSTFFLLMVPLLNIIIYYQLLSDLSFAFKKSNSFTLGLFFLPFIYFPILGFGDATFRYGDFEQEIPELQLEDHLVTN